MSIPAVTTLVDMSSRKGKFKRFVLENNIDESIHLHINNMRADFSINEFLEFSDLIRSSLIELDFLKGYSVNNFDESFLKDCSHLLPQLKKIEIEEVKLSALDCIARSYIKNDLYQVKLVPISHTPVYNYLQGDKQAFIKYSQFNYLNMNNEKRLLQLAASIKQKKYPYNNKYIILFNEQNIIRDGQHRAAILAHLYGLGYTIKVMRFHFHGKKHLINTHKSNFKNTLNWLLKKGLGIVKPQIKAVSGGKMVL